MRHNKKPEDKKKKQKIKRLTSKIVLSGASDKKTQLDKAIEVLTHNYPIYINRLFDEYLKRDLYEDLGYFMYSYDERVNNPAPYFGMKAPAWKTLQDVVKRMRARKYLWQEGEEEGKLYGKTALKSDNDVLDKAIGSFRKTNKITNHTQVMIGESVKTLSKMFKLNSRQEIFLQFLFDLEVSLEGRVMRDEYFTLFCYYETKQIFKNNLFEILRVYVGTVEKSDIQQLLDIGIISESDECYTKAFSSSADTSITPFYPLIQRIYIKLIIQDKALNFSSIVSYFRDTFKHKLTYEDFQGLAQTPIIEKLINSTLKDGTEGTNVLAYGLPGTGKTEMIHALAKKNKWKLIVLGENEDQEPKERLQDLRFAQTFFKNFKDQNIVFLFDEMEDLLNIKRDEMSKNQINRIIENTPFPIFWTTNNVTKFDQSFLRRMTYANKFEIPNKARRKEIWQKFSKENNLKLDSKTIETYAEIYDTAPSVISNVCDVASKAVLTSTETKQLIESLLTAYNHGEEPRIVKDSYVGEFIPYDFSLSKTDTDLEMMMNKLKDSSFKNWNMCLYGAPGTGKSAYARHVAKALGKKVIYKRASDLIDKYVGETEKLIAEAFKEANDIGGILVLDEADSFLQSRSNAIRTWEITQVNEMLTQMENSKEPFICTTNLIDNLDEASLRRFVFKVKFDWMTTEQIRLAFKRFFDLEVEVPQHWKLSPGDFVSVAKRAKILGTTDKEQIFKLMEAEYLLKKLDGSKPIGFGR